MYVGPPVHFLYTSKWRKKKKEKWSSLKVVLIDRSRFGGYFSIIEQVCLLMGPEELQHYIEKERSHLNFFFPSSIID